MAVFRIVEDGRGIEPRAVIVDLEHGGLPVPEQPHLYIARPGVASGRLGG